MLCELDITTKHQNIIHHDNSEKKLLFTMSENFSLFGKCQTCGYEPKTWCEYCYNCNNENIGKLVKNENILLKEIIQCETCGLEIFLY